MATHDEQIAKLLADHGVTYAATFVPQSVSRNAGDKSPSLNWRVSFTSKRGQFSTDYMQGIGHVPSYSKARASFDRLQCERAAETGRYPPNHSSSIGLLKTLPLPSAAAILACLISDARAAEHPTYETWADEYGYDRDSRAGERAYNACRQIAADMQSALGHSFIERAERILADY